MSNSTNFPVAVQHYAHRHGLLHHPPPTSMTLNAALMLLDTKCIPLNIQKHLQSTAQDGKSNPQDVRSSSGVTSGNGTNADLNRENESVYLLPRNYLENWIGWAYHQAVPEKEKGRLKIALRMASELYGLNPPVDQSTGNGNNNINKNGGSSVGLSSDMDSLSLRHSSPPSIGGKQFMGTSTTASTTKTSSMSHSSALMTSSTGISSSTSRILRNSFTNGSSSVHTSSTLRKKSTSPPVKRYNDPGPLDSSTISIPGHPLLMRPGVIILQPKLEKTNLLPSTSKPNETQRSKSLDQQQQQQQQPQQRTPLKNFITPQSQRPQTARQEKAISDLRNAISIQRRHSFGHTPAFQPPVSDVHSQPGTPQQVDVLNLTQGPTPLPKLQPRKYKPSSTSMSSTHECVAVPEIFYELLRSVHGVLCEDGKSVSFQPFIPQLRKEGIIFHHAFQMKVGVDGSDVSSVDESEEDGSRGSTRASSTQAIFDTTIARENVKYPDVRPIEFRRRLISKKVIDTGSSSKDINAKTSTVTSSIDSKLPEKEVSVEVYPVKLTYSLYEEKSSNGQYDNDHIIPTKQALSSDLEGSLHPKGFVLVSRSIDTRAALISLLKCAVPTKSHSCLRLWYRSGQITKQKDDESFATKYGDGFELLNLDKSALSIRMEQWAKRQGNDPHQIPEYLPLMIEVRSSPKSVWPRKDLEIHERFQVGDFVDAQDSSGKWYEAVITHLSEDTVKVHYFGWSSKWNCTLRRRISSSDKDMPIPGCSMNALPPQPLWSHTQRWRDELKVGDEIEIREAASLIQRPKWFCGIVRVIGKESDEVRDMLGGADIETVDDDMGMRPRLLLNRTRQILVEVPQERFNSAMLISTHPDVKADGGYSAQPPFLRWVNLYGEEICQMHTHLKPKPVGDQEPATLQFSHNSRHPVEIMRPLNNNGGGFIRESLIGIPPAPGSVGLHNLGNTCYLNSIIQCLNHIQPLTSYFLKGCHEKEINRENPLSSGGLVATAYASLLDDMWSGNYSIIAPRQLRKTIAAFTPQFNNFYQHDSQEFCSFLMDGIHEDLNRVKEKPYVEDVEALGKDGYTAAIDTWQNHLLRHDSVIVDNCQGLHRSHVTCPVCGRESVKFDVYSVISLPIVQPKNNTRRVPITDCMEQFTIGEQLDEQNTWYCPSCKGHVCALKMMKLWSTPDILVIHLKRFTFNKCMRRGGLVRSKIEDIVDFPVDRLDMGPYILGPIDPAAPPVYELFGVSEHSGSTANSGHYTATVRNSLDRKWYQYNDGHVGVTTGDAAITGGAYLLFYKRVKGESRWAGMEKVIQNSLGSMHTQQDSDGFTTVPAKKGKKKKATA